MVLQVEEFVNSDEKNREESVVDEHAIIRRIQAGMKDEFRILVMRYKDMVYAMVVRQVGQEEIAEEIAQEVFVRAYLGIKQFRFASKFSTWLTRIALNQTHTYFSSRRFRQQRMTETFDAAVHEMSSSDHDTEIERARERETLMHAFREALAQLKPRFRDVLVLCGLEGKSYQEVSELLSIPVGTVKSRLNKARLLLRDRIGILDLAK